MVWQKKIVSQFIPDAGTNVWAVSDPDGLVRNERVMAELQNKGFDCLFFEDPLEFRYEYESRIRRAWERGDVLPVIIIFDEQVEGFNALPSDVLASATQIELGLRFVFPNCYTSVIREIPLILWGKLEAHLAKHSRKVFNKRDTEELVLRVCYLLSPELIDSIPEFFRRLFDLHLSQNKLPESLSSRFEAELGHRAEFADLEVKRLCGDPNFFWHFIARQWTQFIAEVSGMAKPNDPVERIIPFDDPLLRGYAEALLDAGHIDTIEADERNLPPEACWWRVGLNIGKAEATALTEQDLRPLLDSLPATAAHSRDWIDYALRYSKLVSKLFQNTPQAPIQQFWTDLWPQVDQRFTQWLEQFYGGLYNLPASPPVMQHHIPKQLNRYRMQGRRVALIVLDGMSLAGWLAAYEKLSKQLPSNLRVETGGVFSWLPSLTPVCRQAIYSGQAPRLFQETITRTDRDGPRWKAFWEANAELRPNQIHHGHHKGNFSEAELDRDMLDATVALGLTIEKPDKIMHGSSLGWAGWYQQIGLWLDNGYLSALMTRLIESGYTVCVTSDHGNLEATGTGKISQGVLAESRGQRCRLYANESLCASTHSDYPDTTNHLELPISGEKMHPLFAKGRGAFVSEGETIVTHGGASLDEMIVPWVVIEEGAK